jgi:hypothetical protein
LWRLLTFRMFTLLLLPHAAARRARAPQPPCWMPTCVQGGVNLADAAVIVQQSDAEPTLQNGSGPHGRDAQRHVGPRSR